MLMPYETNLKKRLVKSPKVYIRDSGVLHHLLNIQSYDELAGNTIIGNSWEGYVIDQIISILQDKYRYFFYRTQQGAEIDLVLLQGFKPKVSIEIKYSSAPKLTKGNRQAFKDINSPINLIVTPGDDEFPIEENIYVVGAEKLINEYKKWF
jgi:predicted AAA+ superfamily ATPase